MKLLTKAIEKKIPSDKWTLENPDQPQRVYVKYFHPFSDWNWYFTEYNPETKTFFGIVHNNLTWEQMRDGEYGYTSLDELESINILGCPIERDLYRDDTQTIQDVYAIEKSNRGY